MEAHVRNKLKTKTSEACVAKTNQKLYKFEFKLILASFIYRNAKLNNIIFHSACASIFLVAENSSCLILGSYLRCKHRADGGWL